MDLVDHCLVPESQAGTPIYSIMADVEELKTLPAPGSLGDQTPAFVHLWRVYKFGKACATDRALKAGNNGN